MSPQPQLKNMAAPPVAVVAVALDWSRCSPKQHVWLRIPESWRCDCGECEIVDQSEPLT